MKLKKLTAFLDNTLKLGDFREDVSNNGLQIEGTEEVKKILFAVDGCQEVFDLAVENDADMIFVHHGLSWGSGMRYFTGINADRFRTLFANGIRLCDKVLLRGLKNVRFPKDSSASRISG